MPVPPDRCLPEQPGVFVLLGVNGHDLVGVHIDPGEDLEEGLFPEAIGDGRVPPEGPEARQGLPGTAQAKLVGRTGDGRNRAIEPAPGPTERIEREFAGRELPLEFGPGSRRV